MAAGTYWNTDPPATFSDHRAAIFGQVALGTMMADLLRLAGVRPEAAIGYSLGETTALFALGAWTDRDEMFRRFQASTLFQSDLAGPCDAARIAWGLADDEPVDWVAGIVTRPVEQIRQALQGIDRAYLLIVNTDRQAVVGGVGARPSRSWSRPWEAGSCRCRWSARSIARSSARSRGPIMTSTCCRPRLRPGSGFYSGSNGESYPVDRETAADSIFAHALHGVDFPAVIRRAHDDGVRAFVEVGPGASCSRMIRRHPGRSPSPGHCRLPSGSRAGRGVPVRPRPVDRGTVSRRPGLALREWDGPRSMHPRWNQLRGGSASRWGFGRSSLRRSRLRICRSIPLRIGMLAS